MRNTYTDTPNAHPKAGTAPNVAADWQ